MKRIYLLTFSVLSLFACNKNNLPYVETITKGSKWGLEIGSSPEDVYAHLQALGKEKSFDQVAVDYRKPYTNPKEIEQLLRFYNFLTLQNNTAVIDRVLIEFPKDTITAMSSGGALPDSIYKWPQELPDDVAIHHNDPVDVIYSKLLAIYQIPAFSYYSISLPDKPLDKSFDPDMANYHQWDFTMSQVVKPGIRGTSIVRLFFKNGALYKIQNEYNEAAFYN